MFVTHVGCFQWKQLSGGHRLRSVLATSSFLVNGAPVGRRAAFDLVLPEAARIEVLPQFAGG